MKNVSLILICLLFPLSGIGQTSTSLSKFFYDLPIDSCSALIVSKIKDMNLVNTEFSDRNGSKVQKDLTEDSINVDSAFIKIDCFQLAIGGSPDQVSPMAYEQWLSNTLYFTNYSSAEMVFKSLKSELDSFVKEPYLNEKSKVIELIYLIGSNIGNIQNKQIHLVYDIEAKKVQMRYRIIYYENICNCS